MQHHNNHIAIFLPPDKRWLSLLSDSIGHYAKTVGFSKTLEGSITYSVMEACEELIRVSEQTGIAEPFNVFLDFKGEAAIIEIEYSAKIPLNPSETEEYEIPDTDTPLDELSTEGLWLFLIKKQMDRVFFRVRGSKCVLSMMQYWREEGKERRVWAMSIRPELRKGLHLYLQENGDAPPGAVLQKSGSGVLQLGPSETFFVRNMDGLKTFHDLYMQHVDEIGLVSPNLPAALYEKLEALDMLVSKKDDARRNRWKERLQNIISPSFSIPKADEVLAMVHQRTRFFFTPIGVAALLLIGASGIIPVWRTYPLLLGKVAGLEQMLYDAPLLLIPLYLLTLIHVSLHELGHGVTCKHFGGKVPRMGIMFYLASFIFFCDTTAAYTFPEKRQRLLVSLGGPLVSFAIFGLGLWGAGYFAGSGSLWEYVFIAFSLFNFFGLIMNFNPFIKMDAYYMLMDITEIPNLRVKSFHFLNRKLLGWLGFGADEDVKVTMKERRIFWWYGVLGGAVTILFIAAPLLHFITLFQSQSPRGSQTLLLVIGCLLLLIRMGTLAYERMRKMLYREYKLK